MKTKMDATTFLNQPWVIESLNRERQQVTARLRDQGVTDPQEIESRVLREQAALREELLSDLPDEYLDPDQLAIRRERQEVPWEME